MSCFDLSWTTCGSHWSPGSGISAARVVLDTGGGGGGRGGVAAAAAPAPAAAEERTEARYCCPASEREDGGGGGAPEVGVPMRLGSWLLGFGGRIGGVGAWESGGKLDMVVVAMMRRCCEEGKERRIIVWKSEVEVEVRFKV